MENICVERVKVNLEVPIESLQSMEIRCRVNEHATVRMEVRINYQNDYLEVLDRLMESSIQIDEILNEEERTYRRIFCGNIKNILLTKVDMFLTFRIDGVSCSDKLDEEKKSRSFQDINKTYKSIMQEVINDTENAMLKWNIPEETAAGRFVLQHEETDWEFLRRLASQIHVPIVIEERNHAPIVHIGVMRQKRHEWNSEELFIYEKGMDKRYQHILNHNSKHADFLYYAFEGRDDFNICDWFMIENEIFLIVDKKILFDKGELHFVYKAVKEVALWESEKYNNRIKGISLYGTIKKVERENIYVQMDIDQKDQFEYAFLWEPVNGNFAYCMPECGERVTLRFPSEDEQEVRVMHTIRENGGDNQNPKGSCDNYQMVQNRVFTTNKDKQLKIYPDELSFESKGKEVFNNLLELKDGKGISLCAPQKIQMEAGGSVICYAGKILVSALQEIRLKGNVSSLQIDRNFNLYSPNLIENCGLDSSKRKPIKATVYKENKSWVNNYQAIASIPAANLDNLADDGTCMCAMASLPAISDGRATVSMSELLNGVKIEDTSYPSTFSAMENRTMNGGYPPPVLDE